jgi:glycosyltransferase involved in cell wall biosynthesis
VLEDGQTALLIPPESPDDLTTAVLRLADDAGLRERLGAAARDRAVAEHTWARNAQRGIDAVEALT